MVPSVFVSAWLWGRDALRYYRLQFWSHWCRKAASLQGTGETQSNRDAVTFSTRHWFIALYISWLLLFCQTSPDWPLNVQNWGWIGHFFFYFKIQSDRAASITNSAGGDGSQLLPVTLWKPWNHVLQPALSTLDDGVKEFCVFCHMDNNNHNL